MDENKDFFDSEPKTENNEIDSTFTSNDENVSDNSVDFEGVFSEELAETGIQQVQPDNYRTDVGAAAVKKKRFLQTPIIISLVCVIVVLLAFLVFKCFFNTSVVGTWVIENSSTADEATTSSSEIDSNYYYTFDEDGTASVTFGTIKYVGNYAVNSENDTKTMILNIVNSSQEFEYSISGNIFTGRILTLKNSTYNTEFSLKSASLKPFDLKVDEKFKPNEKIIGRWKDSESYNGGNSLNYTYEFNADGTVLINQNDQLIVNGVYTYTDNTISVKYYADQEYTMDLIYEFKNDIMVINGFIGFERDTGSSSDEIR